MKPVMQKIVLSTSHEHGWATEYPREVQEFFLMNPEIIRLVEEKEWHQLGVAVANFWTTKRELYGYPEWPLCIDAIPHLEIREIPVGTAFILNEVPNEHIVILNSHNVFSIRGAKPFPAPGAWFPVGVLGHPMREYEPGKWENAIWPSEQREMSP